MDGYMRTRASKRGERPRPECSGYLVLKVCEIQCRPQVLPKGGCFHDLSAAAVFTNKFVGSAGMPCRPS